MPSSDSSGPREISREAASQAEEQILITLDWLESHPLDLDTGKTALRDRDSLRRHGRLAFGDRLLDWDQALEALLARGQVRLEGGLLGLASKLRPRAARLRKRFLSAGFGRLQIRCEESPAYGELCRRVFGPSLRPFSPLDEEQLATALAALDLRPGEKFLDLGCGVGTVTAEIHRRTGAALHGVDFSDEAVEHARRRWGEAPGLTFETLDLDEPFTLPARYDGAIAIDVLYFLADPKGSLRRLLPLLRPGSRLGIFASDVVATATEARKAALTRLGLILKTLDLPFEAVDLSSREGEIWKRQQAAARSLKAAFQEEGSGDLGELMEREATRCLAWAEAGRIRRFFYRVTVPAEVLAAEALPAEAPAASRNG